MIGDTMWLLVIAGLGAVSVSRAADEQAALRMRGYLAAAENLELVDRELPLTASETTANDIVMALKRHDLRTASTGSMGFRFDPQQHFFEYKDRVKRSLLFELLTAMPKGAVLHAHDTGLLGADYVVRLTYREHLHACFQPDGGLQLEWARTTPTTGCGSHWQRMQQARAAAPDRKHFDRLLRARFTILTPRYKELYNDSTVLWSTFERYFITTTPLFTYKPVWEQYFYDTLKACRDDNVMYLEVRSVLPSLYDLDGNVYDSLETAKSYKRALDRFMKDYPDFLGAKLIYAPRRQVSRETLLEYLATAKRIKAALPDFFAGFDLVGHEEAGAPLGEFFEDLARASGDLDYFFHAGETNEWGTRTDANLLDALALGSRRVGHAVNLVKHPVLMAEVVRRGVAVEACVLANQIGSMVSDIRAHPLAALLAHNVPVVVSSDDPGVWEAAPLTHDLYAVFVGVASQRADLRLLKRLALNSLTYSAHQNKPHLVNEFINRWNHFIHYVVSNSTFAEFNSN